MTGAPRNPKVLVVHVTTVRRPSGPFSWEVALPAGSGGLPKPGVVKCGEVYTLFKHQLTGVCGTLSREVMARVDRALAVALGLPCGAPAAPRSRPVSGSRRAAPVHRGA
jgi:mRNA-degrading endonuclease toxin of MazEF toxin-antitoxin module